MDVFLEWLRLFFSDPVHVYAIISLLLIVLVREIWRSMKSMWRDLPSNQEKHKAKRKSKRKREWAIGDDGELVFEGDMPETELPAISGSYLRSDDGTATDYSEWADEIKLYEQELMVYDKVRRRLGLLTPNDVEDAHEIIADQWSDNPQYLRPTFFLPGDRVFSEDLGFAVEVVMGKWRDDHDHVDYLVYGPSTSDGHYYQMPENDLSLLERGESIHLSGDAYMAFNVYGVLPQVIEVREKRRKRIPNSDSMLIWLEPDEVERLEAEQDRKDAVAMAEVQQRLEQEWSSQPKSAPEKELWASQIMPRLQQVEKEFETLLDALMDTDPKHVENTPSMLLDEQSHLDNQSSQ